MDLMCVLVAVLALSQPSTATADSSSPLNCTVTRQRDGFFRYELSKPSRSSCETCWEDHDKTVIARDSNQDPDLVQTQTNQSIVLKVCRPYLHYTRECSEHWGETHCKVNCSLLSAEGPLQVSANSTLICISASLCVSKLTTGLVSGLILILAVIVGLSVRYYRCRGPAEQTVAFTGASHQIKIEQ